MSIYSTVVLDPLERAAVDALQTLPAEELEDEVKPLFIPFPGTTKQLKPVPYRGSDPEWQEFVKFSKDKKLAQKVRGRCEFVYVCKFSQFLTTRRGTCGIRSDSCCQESYSIFTLREADEVEKILA